MGHFGKTKTKQMLRSKYWFPTMNMMIDELIGRCFECQVATKQHTEEPIKPTVIPQKPWEEIAIDFGAPYPDGHYNLVAIDKRTPYPEVEVTYSTSFKPTQAKLKRMFGHHSSNMQHWFFTTLMLVIMENTGSQLKLLVVNLQLSFLLQVSFNIGQ